MSQLARIKKNRKEIAEIDAELLRRANRLGGGYHPVTPGGEEEETEEMREEGEVETVETADDSVNMRGDNLPTVDLKYNILANTIRIYGWKKS